MKSLSWIFRILLFAPFAWAIWRTLNGEVGADPAKALNHRMGQIALYYLTLNLMIGVLIAYSFRFPKWLRFLTMNRRWLGVVTFFYLALHFLLYLTMESFERQAYTQIVTKLYLTLGMAAFLVMALLAATSNNFSVRRLGHARWKSLHKLVYPATLIVTIHVMLIEKADLVFYGILFTLLWIAELPRLWPRARRAR